MTNLVIKRKWTKKPLKPVFDFTHPAVKNSTSLLSFDHVDANGSPWDDAEKDFWTTDTTNGTTPYKKQSVAGAMQLASQDLDGNSICYHGKTFGVVAGNVPHWFMFSYTPLLALANTRDLMQIGNATRDSSPTNNYYSNGSTLQSWISGGWRFTNTPFAVSKKSFTIYKYDPITQLNERYDSTVGYWRSFTGNPNGSTSDSFWLGTGYNSEAPVAFEYFVGSVGYAPSRAEMNSLITNPYQVFKTQYINLIEGAAPSGFQAAWARQQSGMIGAR